MTVDNYGIIVEQETQDCSTCERAVKSGMGLGWIICKPLNRYVTYEWSGGSVDAIEDCPVKCRKGIG